MSNPDDEIVIADCIEKEYGLVFFYNSKKYIVDMIASSQLVGNAPLLVLYESEKFYYLPLEWEQGLIYFEAEFKQFQRKNQRD